MLKLVAMNGIYTKLNINKTTDIFALLMDEPDADVLQSSFCGQFYTKGGFKGIGGKY